jgi:hypothetical protein
MSPPKKSLFEAGDPTQVAMLERTYLAAWGIICPKNLDAGSTRETELRTELVGCIQKLAARGFLDSDELTKRCVEEMLLGPRSVYIR